MSLAPPLWSAAISRQLVHARDGGPWCWEQFWVESDTLQTGDKDVCFRLCLNNITFCSLSHAASTAGEISSLVWLHCRANCKKNMTVTQINSLRGTQRGKPYALFSYTWWTMGFRAASDDKQGSFCMMRGLHDCTHSGSLCTIALWEQGQRPPLLRWVCQAGGLQKRKGCAPMCYLGWLKQEGRELQGKVVAPSHDWHQLCTTPIIQSSCWTMLYLWKGPVEA